VEPIGRRNAEILSLECGKLVQHLRELRWHSASARRLLRLAAELARLLLTELLRLLRLASELSGLRLAEPAGLLLSAVLAGLLLLAILPRHLSAELPRLLLPELAGLLLSAILALLALRHPRLLPLLSAELAAGAHATTDGAGLAEGLLGEGAGRGEGEHGRRDPPENTHEDLLHCVGVSSCPSCPSVAWGLKDGSSVRT